MPSASARVSDLAGLFPPLRERYERGVALAHSEGLLVYPFETTRVPIRQNILYAQGRTLFPGPIITNAKAWESMHQYGLAIDSAFDADLTTVKVEWTWDGNWRRFGEIMMGEGLEWFGAPGAAFPEAPHVQLVGGLRLSEIQALMKEGGLPIVWQAVSQRLNGGSSS